MNNIEPVEQLPLPLNEPNDIVRVCFTPEAWINDRAVEVDPEGPTEWIVPRAVFELAEANDLWLDGLKDDSLAPQWIQDWSGPFEIEAIED